MRRKTNTLESNERSAAEWFNEDLQAPEEHVRRWTWLRDMCSQNDTQVFEVKSPSGSHGEDAVSASHMTQQNVHHPASSRAAGTAGGLRRD